MNTIKFALHIVHLPTFSQSAALADRYIHIRYTGKRGSEYRTVSPETRSTPILLKEGESAYVSIGRTRVGRSEPSYSVEERIIGGQPQSKTATQQWIEKTVITLFESEDAGIDAMYQSDSKQSPTLSGGNSLLLPVAADVIEDYFAPTEVPPASANSIVSSGSDHATGNPEGELHEG